MEIINKAKLNSVQLFFLKIFEHVIAKYHINIGSLTGKCCEKN